MARVLVTGGTGTLGSRLVPELLARGHRVRVLSRSVAPAGIAAGVDAVAGDVRSRAGLADAVAHADAVVHAATSPRWRARTTEVEGTRNLLDAAVAARVPHFVYVSIVGVDRHRLAYYRAKWEAERLVEAAPLPWTIQRLTQFHELLDGFLAGPVFPATPDLAFQPIAADDAAGVLADLVGQGPSGRVADAGGPEILGIRELRDTRRAVAGRAAVLVPAPRVGPLRDFDEGRHLAPDQKRGGTTWRAWLARRAGGDPAPAE